jgi:hypothetical protein
MAIPVKDPKQNGRSFIPGPAFDGSQPHAAIGPQAVLHEMALMRNVPAWRRQPRTGKKLNLLKSIGMAAKRGAGPADRSFVVSKAAMLESSGQAGGYAVPLEYTVALLDTVAESSFVEPNAYVVDMTAAETLCPKPDLESMGALGVSPFFGGMQFSYVQGNQGGMVKSAVISNVAVTSNVATITTAAAHGFTTGQTAVVAGLATTALNGSWAITVVTATTFTFAVVTANVSSVADNGTVTVYTNESEPKFKQLSLRACDLIGTLVVSNQFVEDIGEDGELALMRLFGKALAWYKEWYWFNGQGAAISQPVGMLYAPCTITTASRSGANAINAADLMSMADRMLPSGWGTALWAVNPKSLTQIGTIAQFLVNVSRDDTPGAVGFLLGRPLYVSEKLPTLGTAGDIILFDPMLYVIGNRQDVLIEASPHPKFTTQQTVFRIWARCDGKSLLDAPATMADGSNTVSSVVLLHA